MSDKSKLSEIIAHQSAKRYIFADAHAFVPCPLPTDFPGACTNKSACHHPGCYLPESDVVHQAASLAHSLQAKRHIAAELERELPPEGIEPHAFVGVLYGVPDRDCEVCGKPDRNPIHKAAYIVSSPQAQADIAEVTIYNQRLDAVLDATEKMVVNKQFKWLGEGLCFFCKGDGLHEPDCPWLELVTAFRALKDCREGEKP
jgi:hypothetical protein